MNYINGREVGNNTNERPLNTGQKSKMMIKYSTVWTQVVNYVWRTPGLEEVSQWEETDGEEEGEAKGKKPAYRFTVAQEVMLAKIKEIVGDVEEDNGGEEDGKEE